MYKFYKMSNEASSSDSNSIASSGRQVIVILDKAALETVKTKKGEFQLLNCDDHVNIMRKNNKDPAQYRPDILHQVHYNSSNAVNVFLTASSLYRSSWLFWTVL